MELTPEKNVQVGITDDHPMIVLGLTDIINRIEGFKVTLQAYSGEDLFQKIEKDTAVPDIMLLDISMPKGMSGYDVAAELKRRYPAIKILAISMYNSDEAIIRMLCNGASGFLCKDVAPPEIEHALRTINSKGCYYSDLVPQRIFESAKRNKSQELNPKEIEFLTLCCQAFTDKEIAEKMNISPNTVHWHRQNLCAKLKVKNKTGLMVYAMYTGLVPLTKR